MEQNLYVLLTTNHEKALTSKHQFIDVKTIVDSELFDDGFELVDEPAVDFFLNIGNFRGKSL